MENKALIDSTTFWSHSPILIFVLVASEQLLTKLSYNWMFGVFTTWMLVYSILLLNNYYFKKASPTSTPWIYWTVTAWTIAPLWFFTWSVWLLNLTVDNKGGKIHKFFTMVTLIYAFIPVVL
jgi:hypothetical protein